MDYGHKRTDDELKELEEKLQKMYEQAYKETRKKADAYFEKFKKNDENMQIKLGAEEITEKQYMAWRKMVLTQSQEYKKLSYTLAQDYTNANVIAAGMIDGQTKDTYALNYNYGTYEVEKGTHINTSFTLYNKDTVERLVREDPKLLPTPRVDIPKDMRWNQQKINSALTQGILQGDSIDKIAERLRGVTNMVESASIRNARTMVTGAQNAGRIQSYERAEELGIEMKKTWLATLDSRTRHSHRQLDNVSIPVDEEFDNGCKFPGDPDGPDEEVYNCRCTLIADFGDGYDIDRKSKYLEDEGISYEEWKNEHQKANNDNVDLKNEYRKQIDTGYKGSIPDSDIDKYNQMAYEQIKSDTGYTDAEAQKLHNSLLEYFGGDYESIINGNQDTSIILDGLQKMPKYDGSIYRGLVMSRDDADKFMNMQPGDTLPTKGLLQSWTSDKRTADSFAGDNSYERSSVVLVCENNRSGVGVQHISKFGAKEAEVLVGGTNYEVVSVKTQSKYDYLSANKNRLWFDDDLDEFEEELKKEIVCQIIVKEKN